MILAAARSWQRGAGELSRRLRRAASLGLAALAFTLAFAFAPAAGPSSGSALPEAAAQPATMSAAPTMSPAPSMSPAGAPTASQAPGDSPTRQYAARHWVQRIPDPAPSWLDAAERKGRVTVRAPKYLSRVAKNLAGAAEGALERIAADLPGLPAPGAIEVRLVEQAADLPKVAPNGRGAPSYAIGVAYPDLGVVSIAMRRGAQLEDPEATLRHELAHIALGAALGDVPRWLHEGFAYQHSAEWSWERTETLAGMVWFRSVIPLGELDRSFPAQEMATHRAYAESYDFVGYLSRRGRWDDKADDGDRYPFRRFLAEIARTSNLDAAAMHAFGRPVSDLFTEWEEDLRNRLMFAPVGLFALGLWLVAAILLVLGWARRRRQARATMARWAKEDELRVRPWSGASAPELGNLGLADDELPPSVEDQLVSEDDVDRVAGEGSGAEGGNDGDADHPNRDPNRPPRYWN